MKNSIPNKRNLAALAVVFDDKGRVLITQRNEPEAPHVHNKWQFPGGGIEFGEHPEDAVIRETKEEAGIDIELLSKQPFIYSNYYKNVNIHAILLTYPAKIKKGSVNISGDPNTKDHKWILEHEISEAEALPLLHDMIKDARRFLKS